MPLPGIAINLADQYLHPRTLATAAVLAAIVAVIDRRLWLVGVLLAFAFVSPRHNGLLRNLILFLSLVVDAPATRK